MTRVFPSLHTNHFTPPMTPSTTDSSLSSLSNTRLFLDHSGSGLSLHSPFTTTGYQDYNFGDDIGPLTISPIPSPIVPSKQKVDYIEDIEDIEMDLPSGFVLRQQKLMAQCKLSLLAILCNLQELRYTTVDLLLAIVNGKGDFAGYCTALFSSRYSKSLVWLLETLLQDDKGCPIVSKWMFPHVLHLVCKRVHTEMEDAKPYLCMNMGDVSPEFIKHWDIHQIMRPVVHEIMPTLQLVLSAAGESKALSSWVKSAKSKNHSMALLIIMAQIHFLCSRNSAKVQIGLRLQAWACGTSRQMINVLHQTCLTVLYPSIANMVQALADCSIERARAVSLHPHALAYDNANVSSSIFVEQGPNTMSKVQSGTFAVIYELLNACAEDMDIKPLIENLCRSSPLVIADLRMKPEAGQFIYLRWQSPLFKFS
jgi:hypothetical protein